MYKGSTSRNHQAKEDHETSNSWINYISYSSSESSNVFERESLLNKLQNKLSSPSSSSGGNEQQSWFEWSRQIPTLASASQEPTTGVTFNNVVTAVKDYYYIAAPVGLLALYFVYQKGFRRYPTVQHMPASVFLGKPTILRGRVTSVGDGDNFRFFHLPRLYFFSVPTQKKELQGQTLPVRLAGVDAPEAAHFGMPAQPFSKEAKEWLSSRLVGKNVHIKIFRKDQYDRLVAMVYLRSWFFRKNISLEMLKAGLATVYDKSGAEYDGMESKFRAAEEKAKRQRVGMWSQKAKDYVSPSDHKSRHKK